MTTARKSIINVLEEEDVFVSPGTLYSIAKIYGYAGTQEALLKTAEEMVKEKKLIGKPMGMAQKVWYKLKKEEEDLSHA